MHFLMGLNSFYDSVVNNILMHDPLPPLNKVYSMIARVARQVPTVSDIVFSISTALAAKSFDISRGFSDTKNSSKTKYSKKGDRMCNYCHRAGHLEEACFKKHDHPNWSKEQKGQKPNKSSSYANNVFDYQGALSISDSQDPVLNFSGMFHKEIQKYLKGKSLVYESPVASSHFVDFTSTSVIIHSNLSIHDTCWLIDFGASRHITGSLHLFTNLQATHASSTVILPNGTIKSVSHIGDIHLCDHLVLKDVLYVPSFTYNLISVNRLAASSQLVFTFNCSKCLLQGLQTNRVVAKGKVDDHLYVLDNNSLLFNKSSSVTSHCNSILFSDVWHEQLGHPSQLVLCKLECLRHGTKKEISEDCHTAKQTRFPFSKSTISTTAPFDLLHVGIQGPYNMISLTGARFFLTIVDDYTFCVWTFLMQSKGQTITIITHFIHYVSTKFGK